MFSSSTATLARCPMALAHSAVVPPPSAEQRCISASKSSATNCRKSRRTFWKSLRRKWRLATAEFIRRPTRKNSSASTTLSAPPTSKTLPPGVEPGLEATTFFEPTNFTFPFGTHICVVEIDRDTGDVKLKKYVAVDDCGNVINPLLVDGQVHGGI